jgi:glycerol-3-phosphate O-acyltransferase
MAEADLLALIDLYRGLLTDIRYSERVTITDLPAAKIIAYGEQVQVLQRTAHPLGDVLSYDDAVGELQAYYRNNVVHLFAAASWVSCCFQSSRRMSRAGVVRLGKVIYPYIQAELFLPWDEDEFGHRIDAVIDALVARGLFTFDAENGYLQRGPGQTDEVFQLRALAHGLQQAFERYYIAVSVLVKNGSGRISSSELETLCHLTAQRLSLLYSQAAPEFFDKSLFRGFIGKLREEKLIRLDDAGKLIYDERIDEWARDAKIILSRELRHSIMKITPETARTIAPEATEQ